MNLSTVIFKKMYNKIKKAIVQIATKTKLKNRIIAESFLGRKADDNITIFLAQYQSEFEVYHVQMRKMKSALPYGKRLIKNSFKYIWYMHTSKYIVVNSRLHNSLIKKRAEQKVIQMWHGIPWKKLAFDQKKICFSKQTKEQYLKKFYSDVEKWDYLWVANQYAKSKLVSAFKYNKKFIHSMYPADKKMLSLNNIDYINTLKVKMGLSQTQKIILYMPTFREHLSTKRGNYQYYSNIDINKMSNENQDYLFLVRTHYLILGEINLEQKNILNMSKYNSIIDLYLVSDILITDYSSALFSFSLLKKPIISLQFDLEEYQKTRGLYPEGIIGMNITEIKTLEQLNSLSFAELKPTKPQKMY